MCIRDSYNLLGDYEKAKDLISNRKFHPWEGGEGKVTGQYILCRVELAKKAIKEKQLSLIHILRNISLGITLLSYRK